MKLMSSLEPEISTKKDARTDDFTGKFYSYLRKTILILPQVLSKTKETIIPNSFFESRMSLILNSNKTQENCKLICPMNIGGQILKKKS